MVTVFQNYLKRDYLIRTFNPVAENHNANLASGKSIALDLLYFPFKESFYVVGGADVLDVEESNLSAALGAGYRHYLSKNMALYFEGKRSLPV